MSNYLTEQDAIARLGVEGIGVNNLNIQQLLDRIEFKINAVLDRSLAIQEYRETLKPTHYGELFLKHWPITQVLTVEEIRYKIVKQTPDIIAAKRAGQAVDDNELIAANAYWQPNSQVVCVQNNAGTYVVTYMAGYDPIPSEAVEATYLILKSCLSQQGDLSWLDQPVRDRTSLSLPGGLSSSFKIADTGAKTQLERLLSGLTRFQPSGFYFA